MLDKKTASPSLLARGSNVVMACWDWTRRMLDALLEALPDVLLDGLGEPLPQPAITTSIAATRGKSKNTAAPMGLRQWWLVAFCAAVLSWTRPPLMTITPPSRLWLLLTPSAFTSMGE
jgi:hypothetical protein